MKWYSSICLAIFISGCILGFMVGSNRPLLGQRYTYTCLTHPEQEHGFSFGTTNPNGGVWRKSFPEGEKEWFKEQYGCASWKVEIVE